MYADDISPYRPRRVSHSGAVRLREPGRRRFRHAYAMNEPIHVAAATRADNPARAFRAGFHPQVTEFLMNIITTVEDLAKTVGVDIETFV
jgi:hypothetical protein